MSMSKRLPQYHPRSIGSPGIYLSCLFVVLLGVVPAFAQPPVGTERFVPSDQLAVVFDQSSGILLPRDEYRDLLELAEAARNADSETPAPLLVRSATYSVRPTDNHAVISVTLDIEQFTNSWQQINIPVGNLLLEKAMIGDTPAVIGRKSATVLQLFHQTTGRFTVELSFSTALGRIGSDRAVGFDVIRNTPVHLNAECPASQHLLLDGRQLKRPQPTDQPATYSLPAGMRKTTELQWTTRRDDATTNTLVFAQSDVRAKLSTDTLRWQAESRVAVFGGQINRLSASVPSSLEITGVESTGLESWDLSDDPDRTGHTKVKLTWRQPFDADRLITISGVAPITSGEADDIPALIYDEITAHNGRLFITHEDQMRLMATTGNGIRQLVPAGRSNTDASSPVFDYWLQDFQLSVAVRPRDRELFSQMTSQLNITDTKASFTTDISVETLNAPLFEIQLDLPQDWQLLSVADATGQSVRWRGNTDSTSVTVEPSQPVAANDVLKLRLVLDRQIDNPKTVQQIALPVIRTPQASTVAGRYTISSVPDLQVAPIEIHGLVPTGENSDNIVFESQGTPVSGTVTVVRKPVRVSTRSEIRCWMDERLVTSTAMVTIDVINGTTQTLRLRLPEDTGDDLRFSVLGIGPVPGYESTSMSRLVPQQIRITESRADAPVDGTRLWHLTFDRRFAGSITLSTRSQQPRDGNQLTAPTVEVPGAIHQEGLVAFEASPDQQFDEIDSQAVQNLRPADPSLVTAPAAASGRRIARVYQFVRSAWAATLNETRYDTQAVPTAVCRTIQNVSLLSDNGSMQRSCRIDLHCIGVQTLRFTLPESENAFLWSTVLNGNAIEVRRDDADYLVAIPTGNNRTDHVLELFFESRIAASSAFAATEHESVRVAIDVDAGQSAPIDVLEQTWQVQYPKDTLLLDHTGNFHPQNALTRPGWLQNLSSDLSMPSLSQLGVRGLIAGLVLGAIFLITALAVRRRWGVLRLACYGVGFVVLVSLLLPSIQNAREASKRTAMDTRGRMDPRAISQMLSVESPDNGGFGGGEIPDADSEINDRFPFEVSEFTNDESEIGPGVNGPGPGVLDTLAIELSGDDVGGSRPDRREQQSAPQLRGAARLSVRVNMEQPSDYQSTDFRSVGAAATSSRLNIVMRTASQVRVLRFLAIAIVLIFCWMLRRRSVASKVGTVASLGLIAVALVPLAPNQWQAMLDGIVLGSLLSLLLWPAATAITWIHNCNCCRLNTTVAGLLIFPVVTSIAAADDTAAKPLIPTVVETTSPGIVFPYTPGKPPLTADKVFIPREEFLKLYNQAYPGVLKPEAAPAEAIVTAAFYKATERKQVEGARWTQRFSGRFVIRSFQDAAVRVTLPFSNVAIHTATLNEQDAIVIRDEDTFRVRIPKAGVHLLDVVFDVPATIEASGGTIDLKVSPVPSGLLTFDLPEEELNVKVNGRSDTFRTTGKTIHVPLTSDDHIQIEWLPETTRNSADTIVHANINSTLDINDQGLTLIALGVLNCRQGSIAEAELTLPTGYSVRAVEGRNIAGWSVEGTDDAPQLKILFRTEVTNKTELQLTLFSRTVISPERQSIKVPIVEPLGASRSTGTVSVLAGSELDIRTESLSGVSQINPSDAIVVGHEDQETTPVLAWRYNRHPADVVVRASRVADHLQAKILHGVQLESERQLWTSSFDVNIEGAPRHRLDIRIPKQFLAFEVDCTDLADWYVTESADDAQQFKTLSIQLQKARTGAVQIVIQGQNERSSDRTTAGLLAPQLIGAAKSQTQLSIWLGLATEISGFQAKNWSSVPTVQVPKQLRKLRTGNPDISFASQEIKLEPIELKLRSAVASVLCESVTVTNVTSTSIEQTLALSWKISRSAADTFSVELPANIANTLDFRISGLRQEERTTLDNDQVRITFHLQYPVSDRFFAAGAGAIPLPDSGEFSSIPVTFVADDNERSPLSIANQSRYWVIVNQSRGVLEAVQPNADTDNIAADQLHTSIPEGFLKQSVAIRRITERQPGSSWRVRFPKPQQTSPAVIALAQHVTVLVDDGTWRSKHTLQVRNESRQFLPVQLPKGSRPLFCLVKDKPTRIVTHTTDDEILHLIPIPQSGEVNAPFEVQFAVAGTLAGGTEAIRTRWQQNSIKVPVPTFPEYRDNKELGVTVARNTWSVHVPKSWSSSSEDDPRQTNVLYANAESLEDAVILSTVDNSRELLKQASIAKDSSAKLSLLRELTSQLEGLRSQRGNDLQAEQDREKAQEEVEVYIHNNTKTLSQSGPMNGNIIQGNTILNERALLRNGFNSSNYDSIISGNGGDGISIRSSGQTNQGLNASSFGFEIQKFEKSENMHEKQESEQVDSIQRLGRLKRRSQLIEQNASSNAPPASRKQMPQVRTGARQYQAANEESFLERVVPNSATMNGQGPTVDSFGQGMLFGRNNKPEEDSDEHVESMAPPVSTGLLSLRFDIPTDGERLDFVRTSGNAVLTLNVRSSQSLNWLKGILWAIGCFIGLLLILRALKSSDTNRLTNRLALILVIAGFAGWLLLPGDISIIALTLSIAGAVALCARAITRSLRTPVAA